MLKAHDVRISMDGKGRCMDNIFIERLWCSVKYEEIYLNEYANAEMLRKTLRKYFHFYNSERPHQTFNGATPLEIYQDSIGSFEAEKKSQGKSPIEPTTMQVLTA